MRFLTILVLLFPLLLGSTASCSAATPGGPLRPGELVAAPEKYLGKTVDVLIVEPLSGAPTAAALAAVEYGQVDVRIPDAGVSAELVLIPSAFKPEDPNRYHNKFDRVIPSPVRVKGDFLQDAEITQSMHHPYYLIRVASWEPVALETPVAVKSVSDIKADPAKWDRKNVVYEGIYENRFEVSSLDKAIWVEFRDDTQVLNRPDDKETTHHARITGVLFSKPGFEYGHLGGYPIQLVASKVEFLKPN